MADGTESSGQVSRWISDAREESAQALGQALEECRQYLLLVANQNLDPELRGKVGASDVVQDTFLEAQRDFGRFAGGSEEELLAWLRRILLNNMANVVRHYRDTDKRQVAREVPIDQVPVEDLQTSQTAEEPPSGPVRAAEETAQLDRALEQLPEHYRQVILLRHQQHLPFEEIGQRLGRSAEAARKLWGRAVEQLQQILEPADEKP